MKKLNEKKQNNYLRDIKSYSKKQKEIVDLNNKITQWKEKAKKIQSLFDFEIPNYLLDEIIEKVDSINHNNKNLFCLINCAVINGRITKNNGIAIKQIYNF